MYTTIHITVGLNRFHLYVPMSLYFFEPDNESYEFLFPSWSLNA